LRQIILITDGCSNVGMNPVAAASQALAEGVVVNVIGVVDRGDLGLLGTREIEEIAESGGGMSRIVHPSQLSQTVQMMTRKTVMTTIHHTVNQELREILGSSSSLEQLPPEKRERVVQVIDDLGETMSMEVALLVDTSASMKPKLTAVEHAVQDLMLSLQAREGRSQLAVFHFPGTTPATAESARMLRDWTTDLAKVSNLFYKINVKGTTPTGPALLEVVRFMTEAPREHGRHGSGGAPFSSGSLASGSSHTVASSKDGIMSDYVV
jgi:Ca-activated chloride channel homolog